ncbi:MAG TPA: hypothetical protein VI542_16315 [Candidatus Tectomicrobia bacterium]
MAASSFIYDHAKGGWGMISAPSLCYWSSTTASFYITLLSNNYVPDEAHRYASAFSGAELSSISFTGGCGGTMRISLTGRILSINVTSHQAEFQANTITWSGLEAGTAHAFVVLQAGTSDGLAPIVCYNSLGGFPIATNGTNLTLSVTSAGLFAGVDF